MQRSFCSNVIILNLHETGENNSTVTILSEEKGIIYATLYGGPKSKLKSLVNQFNSGKIWLYDNPEKKQTKINDFEVTNYHPSFSQNLFKMYAACVACELAIKTHCAGSSNLFYSLLSGFFDGMELCNEEQSRLGFIRFLWRFINLLGMQPNTFYCSECNKNFLTSKFENDSQYYYNIIDNNFICDECNKNINTNSETNKSSYFAVKNSVINYLNGIIKLNALEARKLQINKEDFNQLKEYVYFILEKSIDIKLNTFDIGMGIL